MKRLNQRMDSRIAAAALMVITPTLARATVLAGAQNITANTTNPLGNSVFFVDTGTNADGDFIFSNNANYSNVGNFYVQNNRAFSGSGTFINSGYFTKQNSTGVTTFAVPYTSNSGNVAVNSGTLSFQGQVNGNGLIAVNGAGTLDLHSASMTGSNFYVASDGAINISAGSATLNTIALTGTTTIFNAATLNTQIINQSALNLLAGDSTLNLTAANTSTLGSLTAQGTIVGNAADGTTFNASPAILNVSGGATLGNLTLSKGVQLNLGGVTSSGGNNLGGDVNAAATITPSGIFSSTNSGLYISLPFNNNGTVYATSGSIYGNVGGTSGGTFNVSSGAYIGAGGTFTSTSVVNDNGTFDFAPDLSGRTSTVFNGTLNVAAGATLLVDGGSNFSSGSIIHLGTGVNLGHAVAGQGVTFNNNQILAFGTATLSGDVTFRNAGVSFNTLSYAGGGGTQLRLETGGTIAIGTFNLSSGTVGSGMEDGHPTTLNINTFNLSGGAITANVNVSNVMNFTGGSLDGAATANGTNCTVTILPGATLNYTGGTLTRGAVLINDGNLVAPHSLIIGGSDNSGLTSKLTITQGSAFVTGVLGVGNNGTITGGGQGNGSVSVSAGTLYADTVILGNNNGGSGSLTVTGTGTVTVGGGFSQNDATVNGGALIVLDQNPPASEDPELNRAIVGGYLRDGQLNVNGGKVISPNIKEGITSGYTGTYNQTAGVVTVSAILGVGNDASVTSGSGIGVANITGGTTNAFKVLVGSSNGGTGSVSVSGAGMLNISSGITVVGGSSLAVLTGGTVNLLPHGNTFIADQIASLSVTGKIDLTNNALDIGSPNVAALTAAIKSGFANGTFTGQGITSSSAAGDTSHLTTVALIVNNNGVGGPLYGSLTSPPDPKKLGPLGVYEGTYPTLNDALVKYTVYGDTNLDGVVDGSDYSRIDYAIVHGGTGWYNGDFNYDGVIDGSDYTLIDNAFNHQATSPSASVNALVATGDTSGVPEPGSLAVAVMAVGLLSRRKRQREQISIVR